MLNWLGKFFDSNEKQVNKLQPIVDQINALEKDYQKLAKKDLSAKTQEFKLRLKRGESLDDLLPEAFATVREASRRAFDLEFPC